MKTVAKILLLITIPIGVLALLSYLSHPGVAIRPHLYFDGAVYFQDETLTEYDLQTLGDTLGLV